MGLFAVVEKDLVSTALTRSRCRPGYELIDNGKTHILDFILVHGRYGVDDDPRQAPSKVYNLVHDEAHDTSGEDIIAHKRVPSSPQLLEVIEFDIRARYLMELLPIGIRGIWEHGAGDSGVCGIVTVG